MTTVWVPRQVPQPNKRLFMWATRGRALPADLYVSPEAARGAYREMAKRREAREDLDFHAFCLERLEAKP